MSTETTNRREAAREYYRAIDAGDYADLASLLAPDFTHYRPDRTLAGCEEFVRFMREGRPHTDTEHAVDAVYCDDTGACDDAVDGAPGEVVVRGRLLAADDGEELFGFVDVFLFARERNGDGSDTDDENGGSDVNGDGAEGDGDPDDSPVVTDLRTYTA